MSGNDRVNILMVDDEPGKLLTYEIMLTELGENLIQATSGREALVHLLKNDVAVVLLDVNMPDLDGFELADMIRQHPRFEETAIIFISAVRLTDLDRLRGYERGGVDYVSVPVVPDLLRAKVRVFVDLFRKTRELGGLNRELQRLSSHLLTAQDEERRRIARELHDGLGQELMAAKMIVDGMLRSDQPQEWKNRAALDCSRVIEKAMNQMRNLAYLLHPPLLDEVGLQSALDVFLKGFATRSGIAAEMTSEPARFPRLEPELETAIFRIVQEALTNIWKHSGSTHASLRIVSSGDRVILVIEDNGKGMSEQTLRFAPNYIGVGIGGMLQRVKQLDGQMVLKNTHPGCSMAITIPIKY